MSDKLHLPVVVGGRRLDDTGGLHDFEYGDRWHVLVPRIEVGDVEDVLGSPRTPLEAVSIDDITLYLHEVGRRWRDPDNPWRRTAAEWAARSTGYAEAQIARDVEFLGAMLERPELYDLMESELGDPALLDEWTRHKAVYHRCLPQGRAVHVMVGNVPMAAFSLVRTVLTKNTTVAKVPSRDVVTPLCFANCLVDVDPDHPVSRSLTAVYWEPESDVEAHALERADVVTVWGQADTVANVRSQTPTDVEIVAFGPKRSMTVVLPDADPDQAALWAAVDIVLYDQEACFSTQEVFVVGAVDPFVRCLEEWLRRFADSVPMRHLPVDVAAHVHRVRNDAVARGWDLRCPGRAVDWTVVVTASPARIPEHPLARTVFVHALDDVADVAAFVDRDVQTVAVAPPGRLFDVADIVTGAGADRVVPTGRAARPRNGAVHDGFHPLRRYVRWATVERGMEYKYRFGKRDPAYEEERFRAWAIGGYDLYS